MKGVENMIKAIIFDFDATLYNYLGEYYANSTGWCDFIRNALDYCLDKIGCKDKEAFIKKI